MLRFTSCRAPTQCRPRSACFWEHSSFRAFHRFTIDRTEFGMNYGVGTALGSDVQLTIGIEAGKQ